MIVARNFFPQSFFVQLSVEVSAALSRIEKASSHLSRSPFKLRKSRKIEESAR